MHRTEEYDLAPLFHRARRSPFWATRLPTSCREGLAGIRPVTKRELVDDQASHPPYGSTLCVVPTEIARIFGTSGTSGLPLLRALTTGDWRRAVARVATNFTDLARVAPVVVLSPSDHFGPAMTIEAITGAGLMPVAAGRWSTEARARFIAASHPVAISGVPSYLLHLAHTARDMGLRFEDARVERILAFGEAGASQPAMKARLQEAYGGVEVRDGYGMSEAGPLGRGCPDGHGMHFYEPELLVECLDPESGDPVPDGELGELVITTLELEAQPLIRYRTGDLVRLAPRAPCSCGSSARRTIGPMEGRADDMVVYRGVNIFPSSIADVIAAEDSLTDVFELVVDEREVMASLRLRVEPVTALSRAAAAETERYLAQRLSEVLGVSIPIIVEHPGGVDVSLASGKHRHVRRIR